MLRNILSSIFIKEVLEMNWFKRSLVLLLLVSCVLAACTGGQQADTPAPTQAPDTPLAAEEQPTDSPPAAEELQSSDTPVTIGLVTDLSGRFITFGKDIEVATNLAVEAVNAAGGVNGSPLQVEIVDTGGEPEQAVIALRELGDMGVFAISGPLSSGEAEVVFAQVGQLQIPIITGTANKEGITELGEGWAFRNTATNTALYTVAMPAWASAYDVETAVLVYDEAEPVSAAAAQFSIPGVAASTGLEIVNIDEAITFARGQTDFATTVQRIMETEADGLIIISAPAEAGLIARELLRQGETRPVLGHPAQNSNSFFEQAGDELNDWVLPSIFNPGSTDADAVAYMEAMAAADPEPPTVPEAANYYDAVLLLAQVMNEAGINGDSSPDEARAAIQAGLLALTTFDGVAGEISFNGSADATKTVYVNVVKNGQVEPLQ
jgi:ABC-type branched-subunit amino acid transport system substrate-binding protein